MRHIAIISQGAIHPSALWRTCNGTLGAIYKVHSSASRLCVQGFQWDEGKPRKHVRESIYPCPPEGRCTGANSEISFIQTTVSYAGKHVPGADL